MTSDQLKARLTLLAPETVVTITDLTGTQDHYQASLISSAFQGKSTLEQHRLVLAQVQAEIDSGELHALTLKTQTP